MEAAGKGSLIREILYLGPFKTINKWPVIGGIDMIRHRDEIDEYHFKSGLGFRESDLGILACWQTLWTSIPPIYLAHELIDYFLR